MSDPVVRDILVDTSNPDGLDRILQTFGAALVGGGMEGGYTKQDGHYIARCFFNADFVKFAITHQGYGTVIGDRPAQSS
jgi:hypothetical protein